MKQKQKKNQEQKQRFLVERMYFLDRFLKKLAEYDFIIESHEFKSFSRQAKQSAGKEGPPNYIQIQKDHAKYFEVNGLESLGKRTDEDENTLTYQGKMNEQMGFLNMEIANCKELLKAIKNQLDNDSEERACRQQCFKIFADFETAFKEFDEDQPLILTDTPKQAGALNLA